VLDCFRPHIEFRAKLGQANRATSTSRDLIVSGKTDWARDQADRKGLIEELDNLLNQCFPGGEKRSKIDAMFRHLTLEYLNGFSSWTRMEDEVETNNLRRNVEIIKKMRARIQSGERITDQPSLTAMLHLATEDVLHPGKNMTLLEVLAAKSVNSQNGKPQPVIAAQDTTADEEIPF
jgi:hypothetical protein